VPQAGALRLRPGMVPMPGSAQGASLQVDFFPQARGAACCASPGEAVCVWKSITSCSTAKRITRN